MAKTQNVRLVPILPADVDAYAAGEKLPPAGKEPDGLTKALIRAVAENVGPAYRFTTQKPPFIHYFVEDLETGALVGSCGFKDTCRDGRAEITYATFPQYENQGFGTAAARAIVDLAWQQEIVQLLLPHTVTMENTSTAILSGLKFEQTSTEDDPDDGPVWEWQLGRLIADG